MQNQEKLLELQLINQEIEQLSQTNNLLANQINELNVVKETIEQIEKEKPETEILTPLGAGIFLKTKLLDNKNLIVNVGAKVTKDKTTKETKTLISNQIEELEKAIKEQEKTLENQVNKQAKLYQEVQQ